MGGNTVLILAAVVAWTALSLVVLNASPADLAARLLFFVLLFVALATTLGLAAYVLSFRLFASKAYRGNLERSMQHGGLCAAFAVASAILQVFRVLNWANGALLVGLLVLAQFLMLARYPSSPPSRRGRRRSREAKS